MVYGNGYRTMSGKTNFLKACETWNCAKVKEYLDNGVDVNVRDGANFALKHVAAPRKNKSGKRLSGIQLLEVLLACPNIDVNIQDNDGKTAFLLACINGSREVAERMLTLNIDVNHRDKRGKTAFMWSCIYGRREIVDMLLKNPKIDIHCLDNTGRNAFMMSCNGGQKQIVEKLLSYPIDINCRDCHGRTALMLAWNAGRHSNREDIIAMLLGTDGIKVKGGDDYVQNMLLSSVGMGRDDITRMLLALPGIRVNYQETGTRETALMKACRPGYHNHRSSKCIKMLLGMGSKFVFLDAVASLELHHETQSETLFKKC